HRNVHSFPTRRSSDLEIRLPFKPVPPMIATAKEMISQSSPVCGAALPDHDAHIIAASTEKQPEKICAQITIRFVLMPDSRAASRSEEHTSELQSLAYL